MNWRDHLRARLLEARPVSVYALDAAAHELAGNVLPTTPLHGPGDAPDVPCALAVGIDVLNGMNQPQAQQLINRTRLYLAPHMLLVAPANCALGDAAFRALGFTLSVTDADGIRVYDFDLATYKMVPDWLNARFWAHPERWEP